MGVTRQTVSRWESQAAYPEMEKMVTLSDILGVSCDYLLHDYAVEKKDCILLDADEDWIKIKLNNKKQEEYLLRIDSVERVQFIES